MTREEIKKHDYIWSSMENSVLKERLESVWSNPDNPIPPMFDDVCEVVNSDINVGVHVYANIKYCGSTTYECYFAWRDHHTDSKMDGGMHLHPENKFLWGISRTYSNGFKDPVVKLPTAVAEALLYEVAKQLATKCPYVPETYIKEA